MEEKVDFSEGLPLYSLPLPMPYVLILGFCFVANFGLWGNVLGKDSSKPRHRIQDVWCEHRLRPCLWGDSASELSRASQSFHEFI